MLDKQTHPHDLDITMYIFITSELSQGMFRQHPAVYIMKKKCCSFQAVNNSIYH